MTPAHYGWWFLGDLQMVELAALLAVLVWLRHHENIRRLLKNPVPYARSV